MYPVLASFRHTVVASLLLSVASVGIGQESPPTRSSTNARPTENIVGDALLNQEAYSFLATMITRYGHRLAGTPGNDRSLDYLQKELEYLGVEVHRESFQHPGWVRGDDRAILIQPENRPLRSITLGYVDRQKPVEAPVALLRSIDLETLDPKALDGRIILVPSSLRLNQAKFLRLANDFGVCGALLMNRVNGGQLLARVANHDGEAPPFPLFGITREDGLRLQAQLEVDIPVVVRLETRSQIKPMSSENLVAVLPGESDERIVLGAHFDSWDLGQGAMDNGLGVAQLFEVARLLQKHSPKNAYTVTIVFFNAEEWGLWGSRRYVEAHRESPIRVMVNLDMVGEITGVNAMGFDELVSVLESFSSRLGALKFSRNLANKTWLGGDHHPFILEGIPAITFYAPIPAEDVRYYHDAADTLDKVKPALLAKSSAISALLIHHLANDTESDYRRYSREETATLLRKAGLEKRLVQDGKWPFADIPLAE